MSARLRSLPWWERCEDFSAEPCTQYGLAIPRDTRYAGLGHKLEIQGHVNPQDPDGILFVTCCYCVRAATRRRRLAQPKMVIIMDYALADKAWPVWIDLVVPPRWYRDLRRWPLHLMTINIAD